MTQGARATAMMLGFKRAAAWRFSFAKPTSAARTEKTRDIPTRPRQHHSTSLFPKLPPGHLRQPAAAGTGPPFRRSGSAIPQTFYEGPSQRRAPTHRAIRGAREDQDRPLDRGRPRSRRPKVEGQAASFFGPPHQGRRPAHNRENERFEKADRPGRPGRTAIRGRRPGPRPSPEPLGPRTARAVRNVKVLDRFRFLEGGAGPDDGSRVGWMRSRERSGAPR